MLLDERAGRVSCIQHAGLIFPPRGPGCLSACAGPRPAVDPRLPCQNEEVNEISACSKGEMSDEVRNYGQTLSEFVHINVNNRRKLMNDMHLRSLGDVAAQCVCSSVFSDLLPVSATPRLSSDRSGACECHSERAGLPISTRFSPARRMITASGCCVRNCAASS